MVHATEINPSKNEKTLDPHPEPSVKCVKTQLADCFSGEESRTKQMTMVAVTGSV